MSRIRYKNKYVKSFIDRPQLSSQKDSSTHFIFKPHEFQDPTIIGFNILFDFYRDYNEFDYNNLPNSLLLPPDDPYSAYNYLRSINEFSRAKTLLIFRDLLRSIQESTPWYFKSISGLDKLQQIDPAAPYKHISETEITLGMLESIDLRVSMLRDMYKTIAWDEEYHRWMLPENMRWFSVKIIISEIREFHISDNIKSLLEEINDVPKIYEIANEQNESVSKLKKIWESNAKKIDNDFLNTAEQILSQSNTAAKVQRLHDKTNDMIKRLQESFGGDIAEDDNVDANQKNVFLPMHIISLDMCEFKIINTAHSYMNTINRDTMGEAAEQEIKFVPGRVRSIKDYSLFNIILDEEIMRNMNISRLLISEGMKEAYLGTTQDVIPVRTDLRKTNYFAERAKSIATSLANSAADDLTARLFLGNVYDQELLKKLKNNMLQDVLKIMKDKGISEDASSSEDIKKNISETGFSELSNKYTDEKNTNLSSLSEHSPKYKGPKNAFDLPDMNVNTDNL